MKVVVKLIGVVKLRYQIASFQRKWAEAKKERQEERDNVRRLNLVCEQTIRNSMKQVEEMGKDIANALRAVTVAEIRQQ